MTSFSVRRRSAGFTLTELLVAIGIVAVLAVLSLVLFSRVRASAGKASAVTAMRQIGVGIFSFASENNGYLPPGQGKQGLWLSHHAYDQNHSLFGVLGPYLGVEPLDSPRPVKSAVSSTHLRLFPELMRPGSNAYLNIYASSRSVELANGTTKEVFGFYGWPDINQIKNPVSLADVQNARNNGWKWLIQEADKVGGWSAPWDASSFPDKPVHGDARHRLMPDGSVVQLSLTASKLY